MSNKNLYCALLKAQTEIENAHKDAKNPYYNSTYSTLNSVLDSCKPTLNKNGILIAQKCEGNKLTTTLIHAESSEEISSSLDLIAVQDMQKLGSAITYARRYTLQALIAIGAEDDDANSTLDKQPNSSKAYQKIHEPSNQRFPTYGFCTQCYYPLYLSKNKKTIYCSNFKDEKITHDRFNYNGETTVPDEIKTFDEWMVWKSKQKSTDKGYSDIPF